MGNVMRCGRETLKVCGVHAHNIVTWDAPCKELRVMYKTRLASQADIICGDGNRAWYFRSKTHKTERTTANGETHSEPLNGLLNTVARFEVSRLNQIMGVLPCNMLTSMPTRFRRILKVLTMACGAVVAFNSFLMAKPNRQYPERLSERVTLQTVFKTCC